MATNETPLDLAVKLGKVKVMLTILNFIHSEVNDGIAELNKGNEKVIPRLQALKKVGDYIIS